MGVRINFGKRGPTLRVSGRVGGLGVGGTIPLSRRAAPAPASAPDKSYLRPVVRQFLDIGAYDQAVSRALDILTASPDDAQMIRVIEQHGTDTQRHQLYRTIDTPTDDPALIHQWCEMARYYEAQQQPRMAFRYARRVVESQPGDSAMLRIAERSALSDGDKDELARLRRLEPIPVDHDYVIGPAILLTIAGVLTLFVLYVIFSL